MKRITKAVVLCLLACMLLTACGTKEETTVPAEPASNGESAGSFEANVTVGRQDGERFEEVITLEGMEETVRYEHIRNDAVGIEMDYDYELFARRSGADGELFVSIYDSPANPENCLELTWSPENAETVAASIGEELSREYEIIREAYVLERAGSCIRIDASNGKGNTGTPDRLQTVYIIPAADGCRVASAHCSFESAEGFGRRFSHMLNTLTVIGRSGERTLSDGQALSAVRRYCCAVDPNLEEIVNAGEYEVYWEVASGDARETTVLYRSYTGAQMRFYIDRVTGEAYVTEFVPGITPEEVRTEESLNVWDWVS